MPIQGIVCPNCGNQTHVTHTERLAQRIIRRRRECLKCRHKIVTREGTIRTLMESISIPAKPKI